MRRVAHTNGHYLPVPSFLGVVLPFPSMSLWTNLMITVTVQEPLQICAMYTVLTDLRVHLFHSLSCLCLNIKNSGVLQCTSIHTVSKKHCILLYNCPAVVYESPYDELDPWRKENAPIEEDPRMITEYAAAISRSQVTHNPKMVHTSGLSVM